jgi:putative ABC transport system permease protein
MVYTVIGRYEPPRSRAQFAVKVAGDSAPLVGSLRTLVRSVNPGVVVDGIRTMNEQVDASLVRERGVAWLSAGFGIFASVLGCVGLYGVLSYQTASRTREIGIRLALGAPRRSVWTALLLYAAILTVVGIAIGVGCSLLVTRFLSTLLFGLSPRDPLTITLVCAGLGATALAAASLPARRAAYTDPLTAIRAE